MITVGGDRSHWMLGGAVALTAHAAVLGGVLLAKGAVPDAIVEDPVVLVELPPQAGPAAVSKPQPEQPVEPDYTPPQPVDPVIEAPQVDKPLPREFVATPPPKPPVPRPVVSAPPPQPVAAPQPIRTAMATIPGGTDTGKAETAGNDPKAKREEADYYAMLSAHLNRKKQYPKEAKKAREQGVVTVRFTVHSDGSITAASIRKSSGHALLDQATLDLMQRVAPLPRFPKSMTRDSVTISLPIDYSLRTR
ncbi:energy transducer TonB [Croceicoccus mobilis]|uniref:Protein TonB n=1 Tax=Croceicoccus mobilis TaxID=1703339 RepID=A0A916Z7J9_9SPHN|nr:energy transducer TonB [Croceicoccus mobilis]GGD78698.1 hypothetical protein GCM10010990_30720 [Croceicoccus mobilis]